MVQGKKKKRGIGNDVLVDMAILSFVTFTVHMPYELSRLMFLVDLFALIHLRARVLLLTPPAFMS